MRNELIDTENRLVVAQKGGGRQEDEAGQKGETSNCNIKKSWGGNEQWGVHCTPQYMVYCMYNSNCTCSCTTSQLYNCTIANALHF